MKLVGKVVRKQGLESAVVVVARSSDVVDRELVQGRGRRRERGGRHLGWVMGEAGLGRVGPGGRRVVEDDGWKEKDIDWLPRVFCALLQRVSWSQEDGDAVIAMSELARAVSWTRFPRSELALSRLDRMPRVSTA